MIMHSAVALQLQMRACWGRVGVVVMQGKKPFRDARPAEERRETRRWSLGLEAVAKRIDRHFGRAEARGRLRAYLRGLLTRLYPFSNQADAAKSGHFVCFCGFFGCRGMRPA